MFHHKVQTSKKEGFLLIKQPTKSRGIGLKVWKKRWVIFHPMNDLATQTFIVRLDIFTDEDASKKNADKVTQYLENVKLVKRSRSKSQAYAFEIVGEPGILIYLAGESETDCQEWINVFRNTFWPPLINFEKDGFDVGVIDNTDSEKMHLSGSYLMAVTYESITLYCKHNGNLERCWHLRSLKSFGMVSGSLLSDNNKIFSLIPGPYSKTGEGNLLFFSCDAYKILEKIRHNIQSHLTANPSQQTNEIVDSSNLLRTQLSHIDRSNRESCGTSARAMSDSHLSNVKLNSDILQGSIVSRMDSVDFDSINTNLSCEASTVNESLKPIFNMEKRPSITYSRSDNDLQIHLQKEIDSDGYSQIKEKTSFQYPEEVKERTSSTCSATSEASLDSGVLTMSTRESRSCSDESNDFSTDESKSIIDQKAGLNFQSLAAETTSTDKILKNKIKSQIITLDRERKESHTYQEVEEALDNELKDTLHRISSENPYEELDKFRKDLSRFLGVPLTAGQSLDSEVTETTPPQLPKRPSSLSLEKSPTLKEKITTCLTKRGKESKSLDSCPDEDPSPTIKSCQFWPIRPKSTSGCQVAKNDFYDSKEKCSKSGSTTPSRKISPGSMQSFCNVDMLKIPSNLDLLTGDSYIDNLPPPPVTPKPTKLATLSFTSQHSLISSEVSSINLKNDPWSPNQTSFLEYSFESVSSVFSSPTEPLPVLNETWADFSQFQKLNVTEWACFDEEQAISSSFKDKWEQFQEHSEMIDKETLSSVHLKENPSDYIDMSRARHSISRHSSDLI